MAIQNKIEKAKHIHELLNNIIKFGGFKLKYRITVDPPVAAHDRDWEAPVILVDFSGADTPLLLERGGELLRALECIALEAVKVGPDDHDRIAFDAMGFRAARFDELRMSATVAAEKVRKTGMPYPFAPMSSRERRVVHLALRDCDDLRTESVGEGPARHLVVLPKDYKGKMPAEQPMRRGGRSSGGRGGGRGGRR